MASNRIVLAGKTVATGYIVRHEMLHAIVHRDGHPPVYFQDRCAGVVDCPPVGCKDEGEPPLAAPNDALEVSVDELDFDVDLLPLPVARDGAERTVSLVLRATNLRGRPIRMRLEPSMELRAPFNHVVHGFRIAPAGTPLPLTDFMHTDSSGMVTIDTAQRIGFAPGQTRPWVIDLPSDLCAVGEYTTVGIPNTRQAWKALVIGALLLLIFGGVLASKA